MPKLIIDGREIEVAKGTKVITAAEKLGIMIPRFCYLEALGAIGACRMCAVKFLDGPVKGIEMSCMIEAKDNMVVSTTDPEAVEFRRYVIEWLMLNHPLDCPVCDEGGHCLLQDETVSGGHGRRRYQGLKRTYNDQYLGELVQHEMNRCIHCWRCRRFYQEYAGYRDLGALQIANHMYFGRFEDGTLESPFAGNIIDICPTGVFTDKPSRYTGRRWDYERWPSVCLHCSLGCNIVGSARYRKVVRLEAGINDYVNGFFICDRGRYGFDYANHLKRPRYTRIDGQEMALAEAVELTAAKLKEIITTAGPGAVACWGSPRCSLETMAELTRLCRSLNWPSPKFFPEPQQAHNTIRAVSRLDSRIALFLREIEQADFILVAAADPLNEAPMLALALRQAVRHGARVVVLDPRPVWLPLDFDHLPLSLDEINLNLKFICRLGLEGQNTQDWDSRILEFFTSLPTETLNASPLREQLLAAGAALKDSRRPVLVCGTDLARESTIDLMADLTLLLQARDKKAGLFYLLAGPNAFGAALLSAGKEAAEDLVSALEQGNIKALILVENDPLAASPDREKLLQALKNLELLVVLDYLPSDSADLAQIFLPTTTVFEKDHSHYVNQEGRVQRTTPLHLGGIPISQLGPSHPPRDYRAVIPGGDPLPAGLTLAAIAQDLLAPREDRVEGDLWEFLAQENELFKGIKDLPESEKVPGIRILPERSKTEAFAGPWEELPQPLPEDRVELLLVEQTFGTEELAGYSSIIQKVENQPVIILPELVARNWGLTPGEAVTVQLPQGEIRVNLAVAGNMNPAVAFLPRHHQLEWQKFASRPLWLGKKDFHQVAP
jgi:NADH-quinone oxidoreductase subunit G